MTQITWKEIENQKRQYLKFLEDKTEGFFRDDALNRKSIIRRIIDKIHANKETTRTWAVVYMMGIQTLTLVIYLVHFGII